MSDDSPLIVPITVEALVLNTPVRTATPFVRSEMQYGELAAYGNAEPGPFDTDPNFGTATAPDYYNGVYLKWRLPEVFTHGTQHHAHGGQTDFPVVPNRWLVVRTGGAPDQQQCVAWIVESDYVDPGGSGTAPTDASQLGSAYITAGSPPQAVRIGRNVPLVGGSTWAESGDSLGLTVMAPGNPAFAFYQPACNNVFALIDPLNEVAAQTLRYVVIGWFSDTADDPLAGEADQDDFQAVLTRLNWKLDPQTAATATASWTLYYGTACGVAWQDGTQPPGGAPAANASSLTVGHTSVEALTALVGNQAAAQKAQVDADLLEAFQLDALHLLDQADGAAEVADRLTTSFYQPHLGGYVWEIADVPGTESELDDAELQNEAQWLAALNTAQATLDAAQRTLASLQKQLFVMWWKYPNWQPNDTGTNIEGLSSNTALAAQLDTTSSVSLASQVAAQQSLVDALAGQVPAGNSAGELEQAIASYAARQNLPASRVLKRSNAPRFFSPADPVVLVSGAAASGIVNPPKHPLCRLASQVSPGFSCQGQAVSASTPGIAIALPDLSGVSGVPWTSALVTSLVQEAFLTDTTNAALFASLLSNCSSDQVTQAMQNPASYSNVYPADACTLWQGNPWRPLLLCWTLSYYPIRSAGWTCGSGGYVWNGSIQTVDPSLTLSGRSQLAPTAALNLKARIQAFLEQTPDLHASERQAFEGLLALMNTDSDWAVLSQTLDGFNQQLMQRAPGLFVAPHSLQDPPNAAALQLLGGTDDVPPQLGPIPQDPLLHTGYQSLRAGQLQFQQMAVVDEWGQAWMAIDASAGGPLATSAVPSMTAGLPAGSGSAANYVQLAPTLLQAARLNLQWVSAADDTQVYGLTPDVNPICGWILPNHLDGSLMAYDAQGLPLGAVLISAAEGTVPTVAWLPSPVSGSPTLQQLAPTYPHLGGFLQGLTEQAPSDFTAFLAAIDETLWTTAPRACAFDASLAVLVGRPLAVARAQLQLELDGSPDQDPSWQYTFESMVPDSASFDAAVQLGDPWRLEDGLIGYFAQDDYMRFNVVARSGAAVGGYLDPIGPGNLQSLTANQPAQCVTLLADPFAAVHACTPLLPTVALRLPEAVLETALAALSISIRVNGVLTDQTQPSGSGTSAAPTVLMPLPSERFGACTWVQNVEGEWQTLATTGGDAAARLPLTSPVLRQGLLQVSPATPSPAVQAGVRAGLRTRRALTRGPSR